MESTLVFQSRRFNLGTHTFFIQNGYKPVDFFSSISSSKETEHTQLDLAETWFLVQQKQNIKVQTLKSSINKQNYLSHNLVLQECFL